jgi:uncharacterized protein (UPF0548 family)
MLLTVGSPSPAALDRLLTELRGSEPTYDEVGATLGPVLPSGYRHDRWSVALGTGAAAFDRGVAGLQQWEGHRNAGITVHPQGAVPAEGDTVLLVIPVGPLSLTVPNRIVAAVREPRRFTLVYGTLPGHGEQGEEAFLINRLEDDTVAFDIVAFSRPVGVARLGTPAARLLQLRATDRYLAGLQRFVKGESA